MEESNSFIVTNKAEPPKPDIQERVKELKQFTGVMNGKKKKQNEFLTWICDMFFSGRTVKQVLKEAFKNQIAPQMKDNARNGLIAIMDLFLYKDNAAISSQSVPGSFVTNYVQFSNQTQANTQTQLQQNQEKDRKDIESGYELPMFATKRIADDFLQSMKAYVMKYQTMSVWELAWMQSKNINYTWQKWGWDKEEILAINEATHTNNQQRPWGIILPKAHTLE